MSEQQLPEGWQMVKFGDIVKHISKRVEPSETELEVYVGLEHLDPDCLKIKRHGVPSDVAGQKLLVKKGQIIFGKRRAYQRKVAVADWDCICSAHAMVLEANPKKVIPEFLPFFMQSDVFMNRAVAISEGSLSPTIKWKSLSNQQFLIPNINHQEVMLEVIKLQSNASYLIAHLSDSLDKLIKSLTSRYFKISRKGQFITPSAISSFENYIIKGPQNGMYKSSKFYGSGFPIFHMDDLFKRDIISEIEGLQRVHASENEILKYGLNKGDLLFSRTSLTREGAGKCFLIDFVPNEPVLFESNIIRVTTDKMKASPFFLYFFFNSSVGRWLMNRIIGTMAASSITGGELVKQVIPNLSKEELFEIETVARLVVDTKDSMRNRLSKEIAVSKSLVNREY